MSEINTNEIELLAIEFRNRQEIKETPRAKIFRHKLKEIENRDKNVKFLGRSGGGVPSEEDIVKYAKNIYTS